VIRLQGDRRLRSCAQGQRAALRRRIYHIKFWGDDERGCATVLRMTTLGDRVKVERRSTAAGFSRALAPPDLRQGEGNRLEGGH